MSRRDLSSAQRLLFSRTFGGASDRPAALFRQVLAAERYAPELSRELLRLARGGDGCGWHERHFCALLLEHLAYKIPPAQRGPLADLLRGLGLMVGDQLQPWAHGEGFRIDDPAAFAIDFHRFLARNGGLHRQLQKVPHAQYALRRLLHLSRQSCRVLLARYLFTPEEVVERFLSRVRTSQGLPSTFLSAQDGAVAEADRVLARLPAYEAAIVRLLIERRAVYWVAQHPDRTLNALVEYPLTTVVLVFKPPGSWLEIELKRAGHPEANALRVSYGNNLPGHHRLDGGGYGLSLQWEATAAARAARAFRAAHGEEPSLSVPVAIQLVHSVPAGDDDVYILRYFTDPPIYGDDYEAMRQTLNAVVEAYKREGGWELPHAMDEVGCTNEFLIQTKPAQAIIVDSSSFRVDKVADYMTAAGVDHHLHTLPPRSHPRTAAARNLVDTVLAEVLAHYEPPRQRPAAIDDYIAAALALPTNRRQADRTYRNLLTQLARFWGTLLAWGASSRGESVVARNVGLRTVWRDGGWSVRVVFMDHDQLDFYTGDPDHFQPLKTLPSMLIDEQHLVSGVPGPPTPRNRSLLTLLELIYQVSPDQRTRGRAHFRQQLAAAYERTRGQQLAGASPAGFPGRSFVASLEAWDETVGLCLRAQARGTKDWQRGVKRSLQRRGRQISELSNFFEAFEMHASFLRRYRFLYLRQHGTQAC